MTWRVDHSQVCRNLAVQTGVRCTVRRGGLAADVTLPRPSAASREYAAVLNDVTRQLAVEPYAEVAIDPAQLRLLPELPVLFVSREGGARPHVFLPACWALIFETVRLRLAPDSPIFRGHFRGLVELGFDPAYASLRDVLAIGGDAAARAALDPLGFLPS